MTEPYAIAPPSPWVRRFASLITAGGTVLDVACGTGRHTALFAETGFRVTAIDRDISRLEHNPLTLNRAGPLPAPTGVEAIEADLEGDAPWPLPGRSFDGIVVANYLYRPLLPVLIDSLTPGGVLIYETFAVGNERFGRPRNPDFLLDGELLDAVAGELSVVAYEFGEVAIPAPAIVQRIAAVRRAAAIPVIPPPV